MTFARLTFGNFPRNHPFWGSGAFLSIFISCANLYWVPPKSMMTALPLMAQLSFSKHLQGLKFSAHLSLHVVPLTTTCQLFGKSQCSDFAFMKHLFKKTGIYTSNTHYTNDKLLIDFSFFLIIWIVWIFLFHHFLFFIFVFHHFNFVCFYSFFSSSLLDLINFEMSPSQKGFSL